MDKKCREESAGKHNESTGGVNSECLNKPGGRQIGYPLDYQEYFKHVNHDPYQTEQEDAL